MSSALSCSPPPTGDKALLLGFRFLSQTVDWLDKADIPLAGSRRLWAGKSSWWASCGDEPIPVRPPGQVLALQSSGDREMRAQS